MPWLDDLCREVLGGTNVGVFVRRKLFGELFEGMGELDGLRNCDRLGIFFREPVGELIGELVRGIVLALVWGIA